MLTTEITATMTSREVSGLARFTTGVYACLFSNGTIKVGRGRCIKSRVTAHRSAAACFGITLDKVAFAECGDTPGAEKKLIAWCGETSTAQTSREWFQGVDFDACVAVMRAFAVDHADEVEHPTGGDIVGAIKKLWAKGGTAESGAYADIKDHLEKVGMTPEIIAWFDNVHAHSESLREAKRYGATAPVWLDELDIFGSWEFELSMARDSEVGFLTVVSVIVEIMNGYFDKQQEAERGPH
jgi:hypothetical protein